MIKQVISWFGLALLLGSVYACQFPSYQNSSSSSSSSSSSPSSGSPSGGPPSIPSPSSGSQGGGSPSSSGPSGTPNSSAGGNSGGGGASGASGESLENLDQSLDDSLGEFDDMILQEATSDSSEQDVDIFEPITESGGGGPLFEESPLEEDSEQMADSSGGGGGGGGAGTGSASGGGGVEPVADLPEDIDDGRGDDIVARQIREAAMVEPDPVLRERLWDEYRRYKNQSQ